MANIKSARKRARQAEKTRKANMSQRSLMRTKIKNVVNACDAGDKDKAVAAYKEAVPVIDSMTQQGHRYQEQGRSPQEPPEQARQRTQRLIWFL